MLDNPTKVIGLMSGTSLDGLDICYVGFEYKNGIWQYEIYNAEDEQYPDDLKRKLSTAQNMSAYEYALLNSDYGLYLGERVKSFIERVQINAPQCIYCIPDKQTINFKEALIFAFLGVLYINNVPNCMSSVTGALYDCIGGALYKAK